MKRSTKVPDNLRALAAKGERVRFNGFWLGESARDRTLANWIDSTPQAGAVIKAMIYGMITKGWVSVADHEQALTTDDLPDEIDIGPAGSAFLDFDD